MNLISTEPDDPTSLQSFDQILKTYKKLNGIINSYDTWEKSIQEKESKLKKAYAENESNQKKYEQDLGAYLSQIRSLENSVQNAVRSFSSQHDEIKRKEYELNQSAEALMVREKQLANIEEKIRMREMDLLEREEYVISRENELQEKEHLLKNLEQDIIAVSTSRYKNLNFEQTDTVEIVGRSEDILTFRDEKSFENDENNKSPAKSPSQNSVYEEPLIKKIKRLEEENSMLLRKLRSTEEEVSKINIDVTSSQICIEKEKEMILHREETLKAKEFGLKKRENELVEKTKFVNSMILAVNQQLKHLKSKENTHLTESSQSNNAMSVRDQKHSHDGKGEIANYSSLFYGNEDESEKENGNLDQDPFRKYGFKMDRNMLRSHDHDQTQSFDEMN